MVRSSRLVEHSSMVEHLLDMQEVEASKASVSNKNVKTHHRRGGKEHNPSRGFGRERRQLKAAS